MLLAYYKFQVNQIKGKKIKEPTCLIRENQNQIWHSAFRCNWSTEARHHCAFGTESQRFSAFTSTATCCTTLSKMTWHGPCLSLPRDNCQNISHKSVLYVLLILLMVHKQIFYVQCDLQKTSNIFQNTTNHCALKIWSFKIGSICWTSEFMTRPIG